LRFFRETRFFHPQVFRTPRSRPLADRISNRSFSPTQPNPATLTPVVAPQPDSQLTELQAAELVANLAVPLAVPLVALLMVAEPVKLTVQTPGKLAAQLSLRPTQLIRGEQVLREEVGMELNQPAVQLASQLPARVA
jgi:hypothetical protein